MTETSVSFFPSQIKATMCWDCKIVLQTQSVKPLTFATTQVKDKNKLLGQFRDSSKVSLREIYLTSAFIM